MLGLEAIGQVSNLAGKVLDKVFPDQAKAQQAKQQFALELQKLEQEETASFQRFIVAYEGHGDHATLFIKNIRGSVRPLLTYALAGLYGYGFLHPASYSPEMMQGLFQLNLISLGFWYGERALSRLGLNLGKQP
ncbi:MAG: hypothetical protein HQL53_07875 [Magnetococcales bacterium]|nr:hypothetical protein [Magnetococcales bacterium]